MTMSRIATISFGGVAICTHCGNQVLVETSIPVFSWSGDGEVKIKCGNPDCGEVIFLMMIEEATNE